MKPQLPVSIHQTGEKQAATIALVGSGSVIRDRRVTIRLDEEETDQLRSRALSASNRDLEATLHALTAGRYRDRQVRLRLHQQLAVACDIAARHCFLRDTVVAGSDTMTMTALPCRDALTWPDSEVDYTQMFRLRAGRDGVIQWDLGPFGKSARFHLAVAARPLYVRQLRDAIAGQGSDAAQPYRGGLIKLSQFGSSCSITMRAAAALADWLLGGGKEEAAAG